MAYKPFTPKTVSVDEKGRVYISGANRMHFVKAFTLLYPLMDHNKFVDGMAIVSTYLDKNYANFNNVEFATMVQNILNDSKK